MLLHVHDVFHFLKLNCILKLREKKNHLIGVKEKERKKKKRILCIYALLF